MPTELSAARLADLLLEPRETLNVEIKGWLKLENNEDKATLAKALLALANHGGGFVIVGFTETETVAVPAEGRPSTLDSYNQDLINGIVESYADPVFHCAVHYVKSPAGDIHPVISVPGGHRVPIRAKRSGPNNATVHQHSIYIRRPGPKSEIPQNSQDWDELLARCLAARRDELLERVRDLLTGSIGLTSAPAANPDENNKLDVWTDTCVNRWHALVDDLPPEDPRRCPHGFHWFSYQLRGDLKKLSHPELLGVLRDSEARYSGWPPFWVPTREGITPYMSGGSIECWLGRDGEKDAAHSDFWRVSPEGFAFLLRGYQEDSPEVTTRSGAAPGTVFDLALPVWRNGEVLLHAETLAAKLSYDDAALVVAYRVKYRGLRGRELASVSGRRHVWEGRISHEDEITLATTVEASVISPNLPEIVRPLLTPLYALFDFMELPERMVQEELAQMRSRK
jgi:hypothetical protein